jgi:acyl carrier protein
VLAPKVAGTNAMQAVLGSHPGLDFFVLCSSLAALAGGAGRSDYAAANAFLDAFAAERQRRGDSGVVSINWDTWKDTGMAAAHRQRQRERGDGATTTGGHPLLEQKVVADEATTVFKTRFSVATHWVVRDHLIHGVPTVPGAAYIEMIAAALPSGNTPIEIRGLELRHPLALSGGEAEAFTEVRRRETGYGIRILSADPAASGKGVLHVDATAMLLPAVASKTIDIESLTQRLPAIDLQASMRDGDDWTIDGPLRLGPAWNARFESCRASNEELLLGLELPDTIAEPNDDGHLHVSLFDAALSYAVRYLSAGQLYLPFSYGKLSIFGRMPRRIYSYVRYRATGAKAPEILKFDVSICDLHGREIVTVVNFALKKVGDRTAYQRSVAETVDLDPRLVAQHREQDGLATASGVRAFGRVIAARGFPQILVSAGPLQRAVRPERTAAGTSTSPVANASSRPAAIDQASTQETPTLSPRPSLSTQYAAPADEVEQRIALIWQRMLAVEPIGANDDYMELGGDSLIGTHLAEAIAAEFNIEISIVSLYEALTVRGLAQVVRKALSSVRETGDTDRAPTSERTSYA